MHITIKMVIVLKQININSSLHNYTLYISWTNTHNTGVLVLFIFFVLDIIFPSLPTSELGALPPLTSLGWQCEPRAVGFTQDATVRD